MKRSIGTRTEINDPNAPAIKVEHLHKSFRLPTEQAFGLKQTIFNRLRGIKGYREQKVLKGLNFTVNQGEFLGIVGRNGSYPSKDSGWYLLSRKRQYYRKWFTRSIYRARCWF